MTTGTQTGGFSTGPENHPGHADQKSHGRKGGAGTGRDLTKDGAALDSVVAASRKYPEATPDVRHAPLARAIADAQGFAGPPRVVSREEMDTLIAEGHTELFRGIGGAAAGQHAESYRSGEPFYTTNAAYGQGIYLTPKRDYAAGFAKSDGHVLRVTLHKDARVISYDKAHAGAKADFESTLAKHKPGSSPSRLMVAADPGTWAMAKGYDAISATSTFGDEVVILNRTATIAEQA